TFVIQITYYFLHKMKDLFLLRKDISFLNFGSFGACPKPVFETYQDFQRELESQPVEFIVEKAPLYLKNARIALGGFLNCHEDDVVCITNPSLRSKHRCQKFKPKTRRRNFNHRYRIRCL